MRRISFILYVALLTAFCQVSAQGLPTDGKLTIRPLLQQLGEQLLQGKTGSIVAINPANGEILCLATNTPNGSDARQAIGIKTTYPICGKTGTIENPGEDHSAFIAFAPMDNPKIAISVYVEHGGFGADLAAPMAGLVIEQYLKGKLSDTSEAKAKRIANRRINKQ